MKLTATVWAGLLVAITCTIRASVFELEHQSMGAAVTMTGGSFEMGLCEANAVAGRAYGGPFSVEATGSMLIRDTDFYIVRVASEGHGTVRPEGVIEVDHGSRLDISISADPYYHISQLQLQSAEVSFTNPEDQILALNDISADTDVYAKFAADTTSGKVPHWWLAKYHGDGDMEVIATSDLDGDGMTASEEWASGTLPDDASSVFSIHDFEVHETEVILTWHSIPGKRYRISHVPELGSTDEPTQSNWITATTDMTSVVLSKSNNYSEFYSIIVE